MIEGLGDMGASLSLAAVGSALGAGAAGMAALGAWKKCYVQNKPVPFILALHWGGPVAADTGRMLLEDLFLPGLGDLNAIIAAPNRQREHWATKEAEEDLLALIETFREAYPIEAAQSLVTGYSMGGIGAWNLAAKHPQLFAAVLAVSAQPPSIITSLDWQLPVYAIHSKRDEIFPAHYTQETIEYLAEMGVDAELRLLDGIGHFNTDPFRIAIQEAQRWVREVWGI